MNVKSTVRVGAAMAAAFAGTAAAQTTPTTPTTPLPKGIIAPGVTIAGIPVQGLTAAQARAQVAAGFAPRLADMVVVARGRRYRLSPRTSGYTALIDRAVKAALNVGRSQPAGPVDIPVTQRVNATRLAQVVRYKTKHRTVPAKNAVTTVVGTRLVTKRSRAGVEVDVPRSVTLLTKRMLTRTTSTVTLPTRRLRPAVSVPPTAILVNRSAFVLTVVHDGRRRTFPIAVGQPAYPTPFGNFHVTDMQRNPTWYPPDSRWAAGLGPVAPGAGNPLGTRWMGTSSPGIGMHGTPSPWSIGTRASHGCIRMYIRDAEALYNLISVGTPVYIR